MTWFKILTIIALDTGSADPSFEIGVETEISYCVSSCNNNEQILFTFGNGPFNKI